MSNNSRNRSKKKKQQKKKGRQRGGGGTQQQASATPKSAGNSALAESGSPQTWGQWFGSWFDSEGEVDATHEIEGDDLTMVEGLGLSSTTDHGAGMSDEDPFALPTPEVITINLAKKDFESKFGDSNAKGSISIDRLLNGYKGKAEFEVSTAQEASVGLGKVSYLGGMLTGEFSQHMMVGEKTSGKGEATLTSEGIAAKAELSAFEGYAYTTKAEFKVNVGGVTIATFSGGAGTTVGRGGVLKGEMAFDGGKVTWGGQSTVSVGMGVAMDYKIEVAGKEIASGLWSWAAGWASWLWGVAGTLSEALVDEDGEPIML